MIFVFRFLSTAAFSLLTATSALAALEGSVNLTGTVQQACKIEVSATANAYNIPDISAGDTDRHIATVIENCNSPDGYDVSVVGLNGGTASGKFIDTESNDEHPFSIRYDGVSIPQSGIATSSTGPGINLSRDVTITYDENKNLTASEGYTYIETLTFTMTAK